MTRKRLKKNSDIKGLNLNKEIPKATKSDHFEALDPRQEFFGSSCSVRKFAVTDQLLVPSGIFNRLIRVSLFEVWQGKVG